MTRAAAQLLGSMSTVASLLLLPAIFFADVQMVLTASTMLLWAGFEFLLVRDGYDV